MIIAIDGPAGAGKSTIAKIVAQNLGMMYVNSGSFYRAITYAHIESGEDPADETAVIETARKADITLIHGSLHLDGRNIEDLLHTDSVDSFVAQHSAFVEIRHIVNRRIRSLTEELDAVIEGRDIGTVVYPDAALKVYLDASPLVRAKRRLDQRVSNKTLEELSKNIEMRDEIDKNKQEGSLTLAKGAFYLDTSHLTIEQVCDKVVRKIHESR